MPSEVGDILIGAEQLAARVRELGAALAREYAGREPVLVAIMKGCVLFLADLVRAWPGPLDLEFVSAESYHGTAPGEVRLELPPDLGPRVAGRPVLVIDDICDTGATLQRVCEAIRALGPAEVRTLVVAAATGSRPPVSARPATGPTGSASRLKTVSSSVTAWTTAAATATCPTWPFCGKRETHSRKLVRGRSPDPPRAHSPLPRPTPQIVLKYSPAPNR
jgi:hypoxanthine phosphoribosyltransferase